MPNDVIVVLLVVAAVCLGVALRDYYDDQPTPIRFRAEDRDRAQPIGKSSASNALTEGWPGARSVALFDERMDRVRLAVWLAGPRQVPVKFLDLPYFVRRIAEDKNIARVLRARDTFEPIV